MLELAKKFYVAGTEQPNVGDVVFHQRHAINPHAERKPPHIFWIIASCFKHVRMHHPRSGKLKPAGFFADRASFMAAIHAGNINFKARFRKREIARTQADRHFFGKQSRKKFLYDRLKACDGNVIVHDKPFDLMKLYIV